jgi:hypothetical protein
MLKPSTQELITGNEENVFLYLVLEALSLLASSLEVRTSTPTAWWTCWFGRKH